MPRHVLTEDANRVVRAFALVQRVVAAYETRLADARRESAGLRAALSQLEKEHRALVNEQVCTEALSSNEGAPLQPVRGHLA